MTPQDIADRLATYSSRIKSGSITRARALWAIWQSSNRPDNPLRDDHLLQHPGAVPLNLMTSATLHDAIMILVRALDKRGRTPLFSTHKVSFPVMAELVAAAGVREELVDRAQTWDPDNSQANENGRVCLEAIDRVCARLDRLNNEIPNRQVRLRHYRDEYLAHNLELENEREPPLYGDITGILEEVTSLSDDAEFAFTGTNTVWEPFDLDMSRKSDALWGAIAAGAALAG